jgi:peptide/nickel transport system ATP-binding protein
VGQHIDRPITIHHPQVRPDERRARIETLLNDVGLSPATEFVDKYPGELSGGQRQRVAIARALAVEPEIIFADEPVSMLDLSIRAGILNLLMDLKESRGISFMYITHDLASARYIADRTMVMYAGQIVESGPSDDVLQRPQHPYTKLLVAAVPSLDKPMSTELPAHSGAPNLINPPAGCPFAPRCPNAMDACTAQMPDPAIFERQRVVRCHLLTNSIDAEENAASARAID